MKERETTRASKREGNRTRERTGGRRMTGKAPLVSRTSCVTFAATTDRRYARSPLSQRRVVCSNERSPSLADYTRRICLPRASHHSLVTLSLSLCAYKDVRTAARTRGMTRANLYFLPPTSPRGYYFCHEPLEILLSPSLSLLRAARGRVKNRPSPSPSSSTVINTPKHNGERDRVRVFFQNGVLQKC